MKALALPLFALAFLSASPSFALGIGDTAPGIPLDDVQVNDTTVTESILTLAPSTSYTMLEFFSITCSDCQQNLPILSQLAHDVSATTTTRLVSLDRDASQVRAYVDANRDLIQFPTALDDQRVAMKAFGVTATPTVFIVDAKDTVIYMHVGVFDDADLAQIKGLVQ